MAEQTVVGHVLCNMYVCMHVHRLVCACVGMYVCMYVGRQVGR